MRLMPIGRRLGLISDTRWSEFEAWQRQLHAVRERAERAFVTPGDAVNAQLVALGSAPLVGKRATLAEQ